MSTLTDMLRDASVGEVIKALVEASVYRDGFAFDVAEALFDRNASKEFSGPDPSDINPKALDSGEVCVLSYDPDRREDAVRGFREIWNHPVPTFDEADPKWLKATRAERRAAKRAAEHWVKDPRLDPVPRFLATLDHSKGDPNWGGWSRPSCQAEAPQSRAAAEAEVARWATFGVKAEVRGYEAPDTSHRRTLREHLCSGPTA